MPSTFLDLTQNFLGENLPESALYDPTTNINYGVYYLSWLYSKFENWETVAAAYNAGLGVVYDWLDDPSYSDDGVNLKHIPIDETRAYVRKVTSARETYERLYFT
jgi:soluble lytic murein transglycosylase